MEGDQSRRESMKRVGWKGCSKREEGAKWEGGKEAERMEGRRKEGMNSLEMRARREEKTYGTDRV